ncbi:hypothetical protein RQP46_003596 [Phenoliferia psychrophenolica]
MVGIQDLPYELLLHILELRRDANFAIAGRHNPMTLMWLAWVSLVAHSWTAPAQAVMWQILAVPWDPERQLASPCWGRYPTFQLDLIWSGRGAKLSRVNFVHGLHGIRTMSITGGADTAVTAPASLLSSPAVENLKELHLNTNITESLTPTAIPFRLGSLTLGSRIDASPSTVIAILKESTDTLTTLTLHYPSISLLSSVLVKLPLVSTSLQHLCLLE